MPGEHRVEAPTHEPICKTVEMHTGGEPVRIIVSGFPEIKGETILEQRRYVKEHLDHYRKCVLHEPRGHFDMFCALLVKPTVEQADLAVIFMHNDGYITMCGHVVISLARYAVDHGLVKNITSPETKVNIQCPCGLVTAYVAFDGKKAGAVRFISVPAFVYRTDIEVDVPRFGKLKVDISYGGAFYAFISADKVGLDLKSSKIRDIADAADEVSAAIKRQVKIEMAGNKDLSYLSGTILTDGNDSINGRTSSHVCVFGDRQVDRSPCGSGVTARVALQHHKQLIQLNQTKSFQSCRTKAIFTGKPVKPVSIGQRQGVRVEISGKGFYCGSSTFTLEQDDLIGRGFLL
ncbi:trans-L-3-hydroxyproline dehydratase [Patella vulgata]|uniref:trans-L-3-hydroxyproline dehydratase n=1 Tax=Patella vulgata TaxID=6465 RepID=UPI0024A8CA31|nr:trans-L-3-hydroxyproline dehydratase [Patella vulgata]